MSRRGLKWLRGPKVFYLLLGVTLLLGTGCRTGSGTLDPGLSLGPSLGLDQSVVFQRALRAEPGTSKLEKARIDYLLERVRNSPYNFIRNGSRYTGKQAEAHFRWKYSFSVKRVKTAEDFIVWIATRSKLSGHPYFVEFLDKRRSLLRGLLTSELEHFDQALQSEREAAQALQTADAQSNG